MIKFVLILTSVMSLNFAVSFSEMELRANQETVKLIFSQDVIAVESGQPVYPSNTKVWVSNTENAEEVKLLVNEKEMVIANQKKIDLSKITKIESGTYTLIVKANQENTFGFTIQ